LVYWIEKSGIRVTEGEIAMEAAVMDMGEEEDDNLTLEALNP
jgi:hypothetical protein